MNADNNKITRAGRYVRQGTGYRAFLPNTLPPDPPVDLSGRLRGLLSEADYALGARITERLGRAAANGHRIMDQLFDHPIITTTLVREWLGVTPSGAINLVNRLADIGLLREITGYTRNRRFRFDPYLQLFEESPTTAGETHE